MSKIEWTDVTWNPVIGCAKVSAGCKNCYAERSAHRVASLQGGGVYLRVLRTGTDERGNIEQVDPRWNGRAVFLPERLGEPLRWRKPRRVFVNSMSDLFHEDIFTDQIAEVFRVMALTPHLTYQVLTKRPRRMAEVLRKWEPLPNVHLGVSVEDQAAADERIPLLLQCPAALRFLSVEPLLGPVDLGLMGTLPQSIAPRYTMAYESIGWVIVGGESGPGARACEVSWIRSVVEQCRSAGVPVFVKQLGARPTIAGGRYKIHCPQCHSPGFAYDGRECRYCEGTGKRMDSKGADPNEWPDDLRVQEFPGGAP